MPETAHYTVPTGVALFATGYCPYCHRAEAFLKSKGAVDLQKILIDDQPEERARMLALAPGRRTVPQIFIAGEHIGGCDDLMALAQKDPARLDRLLAKAGV